MKSLFASALLLMAATPAVFATDNTRIPPDGFIRVSASFSPNSILAGQATTFTWRGIGADYCEITGVPGLATESSFGSLSLTPTASLQAHVYCENNETGAAGGRTASLTVQPGNTPPVVNVSFSPASIYVGASSTFSWSSQYATSCSSTGLVSVASTSGSASVSPASSGSVTVTCTGVGGQTSATANLTVSPVPPSPPYVHAYASPSWLTTPGWVWINYWSTNANYCSQGGPSGAYTRYFSFSGVEWIHCYGPGGTGFTTVWVTVSGRSADAAKAAAKPDLRGIGLDLNGKGITFATVDLNADRVDDVIVHDAQEREIYVIVSDKGHYNLAKVVGDVDHLQQVKGISVPTNAKAQDYVISIDR
ncbi:hypothetical protein [Tahibacter amnicola]|uniref:BIG2 domain-containing protein n=1 Tax=Tahibacter amnicola TaxID=2976241 RepID=A0ABY6BHP6_9GAMM|nr:hypothetical protein [Tahibacter amnicola]UXI69309.1 hypothetical protein N4264_06580 [Tahibacter amnicola]